MEAHDQADSSPPSFSVLVAKLEDLYNYFSSMASPDPTEGQNELLTETIMSGFSRKNFPLWPIRMECHKCLALTLSSGLKLMT